MTDPERSDLLHGVAAIADYLNMRRRVAQHRIDKGEVPTFRLGKNVCARRSTLNAWLAECEAKARPRVAECSRSDLLE